MVDNGQIFSVDVGVRNPGVKPFTASIRVITDSSLEVISRENFSFTVDSGKSYYSSVQVHVNMNTSSEGSHRIIIQMNDSSGNYLAMENVTVYVNSTRHVELVMLQNSMQFTRVGDTVVQPCRLVNLGNTSQLIRLVGRLPGGKKSETNLDRLFLLAPFQDSVISVPVRVSRNILNAGHFSVTVSALYPDGDLAGIGSIEIHSLKSQKRFGGPAAIPGSDELQNTHMLEVNGQYLFTTNESFQITGGSEVLLNKSHIFYNLDVQFWTRQSAPVYVRNTYVDFRKNDDGILLGNISRNFDIPLVGRGGLAYVNDTIGHSYYELGVMDGNYNLVGPRNYEGSLNSSMAWAQYRKSAPKWNLTTTGIYDHNRLLNENDFLLSNEYLLKLDKRSQLQFTVGLANTRSFSNDTEKFSGSAGVLYAAELGSWGIRSVNSISSNYYPGIRRGAKHFDEKVAYRFGNNAIGLGYTHYEYEPKYLNPENNIGSYIRSDRLQLAMNRVITDYLSVFVTPQYYFETNLYSGFNPPLNATIKSADVGVSLNYFQSGLERNAYLLSETGIYEAPLVNGSDPSFHFKMSLNARIKWISLTLFTQLGEFYASDVGSRYLQGEDYTRTYTLSPQVQRSFFQDRLLAELGFSYNYSNVSYTGFQLNARVQYTLHDMHRFYVSLRSYQYESPGVGINDLRLGYQRGLPVIRTNTGRKKLRIFVFLDENFNNKFDAGEVVGANVLLNINGEFMITDRDGNAEFKALPKGDYLLSAPSRKGWDAPERLVSVQQKTRIELPLRRSCILSGKILYEESKGIVYEVAKDREQILIRATAPNGNVYETKSDEDGGYLFYVPPGQYEIEIPADEMPDKVECRDCRRTLELKERDVSRLDFHFRIKRRDVYLQKFTSPNSKKNAH